MCPLMRSLAACSVAQGPCRPSPGAAPGLPSAAVSGSGGLARAGQAAAFPGPWLWVRSPLAALHPPPLPRRWAPPPRFRCARSPPLRCGCACGVRSRSCRSRGRGFWAPAPGPAARLPSAGRDGRPCARPAARAAAAGVGAPGGVRAPSLRRPRPHPTARGARPVPQRRDKRGAPADRRA